MKLKSFVYDRFSLFPVDEEGRAFPESCGKVATRHLMRWIKGCPPLLEELSATGYQVSQKVFTSRQVALIHQHLGTPG